MNGPTKRPSELVFDHLTAHPRGWSLDELHAHFGGSRDRLREVLRWLMKSGAVLFSPHPSERRPHFGHYRLGTIRPAHYGQGSRRKSRYTDETEAAFVRLLPATTATLQERSGHGINTIRTLLHRVGAKPDRFRVWHPRGTKLEQRASTIVTEDVLGSCGDSITRWVETAPTTAGFTCTRRKAFVTYPNCHDDYVTAECRLRGHVPECRGCPTGRQRRDAYGQGADL